MDKLDHWILKNISPLGLQITQYSWPEKWWPGLSDISAKIEIEGREFFGRGSGNSEEIATRKAIVEALERVVVFKRNLPSSNGVAANPIQTDAQFAAMCELIERDRFLRHFLSLTPFTELESGNCHWINQNQEVFRRLKNAGVEVYMRVLVDHDQYKGVVCIAHGSKCNRPWGLCIGMSVGENFDKCAEKSLIECIRHIIPLLEDKVPEHLTVEKFRQISEPAIEDHFKLGLDLDYADWFVAKFCSQSSQNEKIWEVENSEILFEDLQVSLIFPGCPISVMLASSSSVQNLFFGKVNDSLLNPRIWDGKKIHQIPHPIC